MSHQPSQLEQATAKASEAYEAVSNKLMQAERKGDGDYDADRDPANFGYDTGGNKVRKGGLKEQLDDKAIGASSQRKEETLVEKGKGSLSLSFFFHFFFHCGYSRKLKREYAERFLFCFFDSG
jgi:hypothetical protein